MPIDSERVKTREKLDTIASEINAILMKPWMDVLREGPSPLTIITDIFGLDIRAGGELNPLADAEIEALIPKAEGCLSTLKTLQKFGMFPPSKPWSSFPAAISR